MTEQEIEALCLWIEDGGPECAPNELRNSALKDALTAIRQLQQPWRGMESAPKDGTDVLIAIPYEPFVTSAYWSTSIWAKVANPTKGAGGAWIQEENRSDTYAFFPTHWQPLPTPPETGQ